MEVVYKVWTDLQIVFFILSFWGHYSFVYLAIKPVLSGAIIFQKSLLKELDLHILILRSTLGPWLLDFAIFLIFFLRTTTVTIILTRLIAVTFVNGIVFKTGSRSVLGEELNQFTVADLHVRGHQKSGDSKHFYDLQNIHFLSKLTFSVFEN